MPIKMTERLFVHINNDAFLKGSKLQGEQFGTTITYLKEHVADVVRSGGAISEEIQQLLRSCTELVDYERGVANSKNAKHLDKVADAIIKRTLFLKKGEAVLVPGGWMDDKGGHAMIYQITKDAEGNTLFRIHNAGEGIQYHAKRDEKDKLTYNPVLTYKIPKEKMDPRNFRLIMKKAMEARILNAPKRQPMSAKFLYEGVFPLLEGHLGAEVCIDPHETYRAFTAGQMSGTCAERSLHQMMKSSFAEKDDYRRFIYHFKARSLEDYWHVLHQEDGLQQSKLRAPVEKAIRHQLRLLNLKKTKEPVSSPPEELFSYKEKARETRKLVGYLEELRRFALESLPARRVRGPENALDTRRQLRFVQPLPVRLPDVSAYKRDDAEPVLPIAGGKDLLSNMDKLIAQCAAWRGKAQFQTLFEHLEAFITHLPVTTPLTAGLLPYYSEITTDAKFLEFIQKLNKIQSEYFLSVDALAGASSVLPRQLVAKVGLIAVTAHVNANRPIVATGNAYCTYVSGLYSQINDDSVYMATHDPMLDERWKEVSLACRSLPRKGSVFQYDPSEELIGYYLRIIDSEDALKKQLEALYQKKYSPYFEETALFRDFYGRMQRVRTERALELKNVNNHHCEAMYYFCRNMEELRQDATFAPLLLKFDLQRALEAQYSGSTCRLESHPEPDVRTSWLEFTIKEDGPKIVSTMRQTIAAIHISNALMSSKYGIQKSVAANAIQLVHPKKEISDNNIQLIPNRFAHLSVVLRDSPETRVWGGNWDVGNYVFGVQDLEDRELYHLRQSKHTQIPLTLDYFHRHLEKLNQPALQVYIEANLFQPGLLKTQLLDNAPDFFKLLDGFIENGLDFNQKNTQFTADALFFIRLGTLVYQYAAKLDPARFDARLQAFHHQLNVHIATQKDPAILTSLHFYRFQSLLSQQGMDDADELTDALKSHFHLQVHAQGKRKLDTDSAFHYHELKHQFVRKLKTKDEHISNFMVLNLLSSLGVTLDANSAPKVTKAYPLYTVTDGKESYILNLETGLLFQGEMAYATTPLEILTHRVTKSFGLQNKVLCFTSVDQKVFLVEKPPVSLRFIREGEGFRVQKKWADPLSPAVESWYELTPRTKLQSQYWQVGFLNLSSDAPSGAITGVGPHPIYFVDGPLPLLFDERESTIWRSVDDQTFLVADANLKVTCRGDVNTGCLVNFPEGDRRGQLCQDQSWIHQRLSHFEDPAFIMVWALNPEEYLVDLPRIGMRMKVQRTRPGEPFDFIYEQDGVSYTYDQEAPPLGEGVAQLTFRHDTQTFCVLAIQPFIHSLTRSNTTEYGHLKQDISRRIPPHLMKRALSWQYSGSEHVMRVKMENGEPLPSNTEQALYLTYVYLCSNQPEKAWAMLEACLVRLGGLEGTYAELKYLHWIVEYMPYPLMDDDKENEDAIVVNPQNVACKLKALALLSQFSRRTDKKIVSPALSAPEDTDNGRYEQLFINSTQDFYSSYQTKIYKLFTQLQGLRRELPASFTLKDAETKSLLDDYHGKQPFKSVEPGALGYERVQLHLNILRQEWADLRAKVQTLAAAGKPPDRYANQRLEVIETFIKNYEDITRTTSRLRYVSHYFPFSGLPLKLEAFSDKFQKELNDPRFNLFDKPLHPETHQDLVASLSLETTDVMMLSQFNELLSIAFTVNHPSKQALLTFCRAVLIADRKIILGKETENMPMLCNLLARIACYTETAEADVLDRGTLKSDAGDEVEIRFNHQIQMNERIKLPQSTMNALWKVNLYAHRLPNLEPVAIPALFDDTVSVMESTSNLWEKTPTRPVLIRPEVSTTQTKPRVREWLSDAWVKRRDAWLVLETAFQSAEGVALPLDVDTKGFSREEYQAGCTKYNSLKALQAFASQELSDPERLDDIEKISEMKGSQLTETQEALEKDILALGNLGPDDPVLKQAWVGDIHSGKRAALDIHGLLTLYFHADQSRYAEETGLSSQKINELHALLVQYLAEGIQLQQCTRVTAQVTALKKATTDEDKQRLSYVLAQALFSMNRVDVVKDPTLSLFQFYEDKLLRAQQQEVLDRFLNKEGDLFDESIEKIIMGGGKSKVILPALAQKKADGTHLILIEVPRALLRTNYVDLKATSSSLFHQDAYLFEFNRDSTCTAFRLEQLFHELTDVMVNKRYVVTTGDALQSLELKYIELLNEKPKTSDVLGHLEWKNRVLWAERLVSLVKHRGDVIIDEVHQGLLLKTQLNYTIGEPTPLPPFVIQHAIEMYRFFKQVDIGAYFKPVKPGAYTLEAAIASRDEFTEPLNMKNIMQALVRQLISHGDSPLKALILDWRVLEREDVKSELTAYLLGESTAVPGFIRKGTLEMKQQIAFYKEQISNMLPFTLKRHQGEHFGPSKKVSSPMDRLRAIPYSANNVPNEQSRFGNTLETIDYTIQSLLITGVDANVVRILVKDWVAEGYHEARVLHCKSFDDTPMAERFRQLVQGRLPLQLSELNPDDEGQIQQIAQVLGREPSLIYAVLNDHVLPTIKTNDTILHSNAYSHVDLLRTCQSMSGTPWNRSTFHQRLHYSEASGRGTDGYVVRAIEEKKPFIRGIDFDKPKTFIESLLAPSEQPTTARAIIDISASFKGVSNITVAADLARYIHAHPSQFSDPEPLKFVLFFNEGVLSALKVQDKIEGQMPVVIGSSDPDNITDKLGGCSPYGRFTYYDQEHTVGTDVKQGVNTKALVLIDTMTHAQHFLQGTMRMRELIEGNQTIDIIVPKAMKWEALDTLLTQMVTHEKAQLQQDNFSATLMRMKNMIRDDFKQRLLSIPESETLKKHTFLQQVHTYFFEEEKDFFKRYGGIDETRKTEDLLQELQTNLLEDWKRLLVKTGEETIAPQVIQQMQEAMGNVVAMALKPGACATHQVSRKGEMAVQVEVQQEQQVEVQVEVEMLVQREVNVETYDPSRVEKCFVDWTVSETGDIINTGDMDPAFLPLQQMCLSEDIKTPNFSIDIVASQNYHTTYEGQTKRVGMFLKPVHAMLFIKEGEKLKCILLTQKECDHLCANRSVGATWWITTTQHTTLSGKPPAAIRDNPTYQSMIEQIRFFNGEFQLLLRRDSTLSWLEEDTQDKLAYFKKHLQPCREVLSADASALYNYFLLSQQLLITVAKTPWEDRTQCDLASIYRGSGESNIREYKAIAAAFQATTLHWQEVLDCTEYCQKYHVPTAGAGYLRRYMVQLGALNALVSCFKIMDFTGVSEDIKQSLIALSPELETLLPPAHPTEKQAYDLVCFLLQRLPMCSGHPDLLRVMASNPLFYSDVNLPKPFVSDMLLAMATQSFTPKDKYLEVMTKVAGQVISSNILQAFLADRSLSLPLLLELIASYELNEKHMELIIKRTSDLGSQALFDLLVSKLQTARSVQALKAHPMYARMTLEQVQHLMNTTEQDEMITEYLQHPRVDEATKRAVVEHKHIAEGSLAWIAESTTSYETLAPILQHQRMQEASVERDRVYLVMVTNAITPKETLVTLAPKLRDDASIVALLSREDMKVPDAIGDGIIRILIVNPNTSMAALLMIINKAYDKVAMSAILERADMNSLNDQNLSVFKCLVEHPTMQELSTLVRLIGLMKDSPAFPLELLERLSQTEGLSLETKTMIVNHPNASVTVLRRMLSQDENEAILKLLLVHPDRNKLQVDELLLQRFSPLLDRLKETQFFENDTSLDQWIASQQQKIGKMTNADEIALMERKFELQHELMNSPEVKAIASAMCQLERAGKHEELQKWQQLLREAPLEERQRMRIVSPSTWSFFSSSAVQKKEGDELLFSLRRLGMSSLKQQAKADWDHLFAECHRANPQIKKALLIAQIQYVIHHLEEKQESVQLPDPSVDAVVSSFKTLISHFEKGDKHQLQTAVSDVQSKMQAANKGPLVSKFRSFQGFLQILHDAWMAIKFWEAPEKRQTYFDKHKTKSHHLLIHLDERLMALSQEPRRDKSNE